MTDSKDEICKTKNQSFYRKPKILGPLIILGGLGAGYLLCPESKDEINPNNKIIRNSLMLGGVLVGGAILIKHIS